MVSHIYLSCESRALYTLGRNECLYPLLTSKSSLTPSCLTSLSITLSKSSTWTYCGPLLDPTSLPLSFHTWLQATVNGDLLPSLLPFLDFVYSFLVETQLDHYWLTIRATCGNYDFNMPRWHTFREFFHDKESRMVHWKLCTTLVGPGTLFLRNGAKA